MKLLCFIAFVLSLIPAGSAEGARRTHGHHRTPNSLDGASSLRTILEAEANRDAKSKNLMTLIRHPNPVIAKSAILALGRIGDPIALEPLADLLNKRNRDIRMAAAFSLGLIGGDVAVKLLGQHASMHKEGEVTGAILTAIGRSGNESSVNVLSQALLTSNDKDILFGAGQGLGILWSGESGKWAVPEKLLPRLLGLTVAKDKYAVAAAFALARFKGDWKPLTAIEVGEALGKVAQPEARSYLIRALGKIKAPTTPPFLIKELAATAPDLAKIEAAKALATQDYSERIGGALSALLSEKNAGVVTTALDAIGSYDLAANGQAGNLEAILKNGEAGAERVVAVKAAGSDWIRATSLKNLARIHPAMARQYAEKTWANEKDNTQLRAAAAYALARIGGTSELDLLAEWLPDAETRVVIEAVDGLSSRSEETMSPALRVTLKRLLEKADVGITSQVAGLVEQYRWRDFAPILATIYRFFTSPDHVEGKVAVLNALATAGDSSHLEVIQLGIKDRDKTVVVAAVKALKAVTGKDQSQLIPLNSQYSPPLPSNEQIRQAISSRVLLKTTRGDIQVRMLAVAPLTAVNVVKLVKDGFYNDRTFHRVVPNFVIQGGDPRGDGFGGPGYLIRDEVSSLRHVRGTLGIATAGKDTGGCQFFINTGTNLHLDGKYTLFAEVIKGMEVADRIEVGDAILSAKLL